jgi:transcriptional regulator with XRE-family HTH domain
VSGFLGTYPSLTFSIVELDISEAELSFVVPRGLLLLIHPAISFVSTVRLIWSMDARYTLRVPICKQNRRLLCAPCNYYIGDTVEMSKLAEILAKNMVEARRRAGLTQDQLAEAADLSLNSIKSYERQVRFPPPDNLEKVARALNLAPYQLFMSNPYAMAPNVPSDVIDALSRCDEVELELVRRVLGISCAKAGAKSSKNGA